MMGVVSFVRGMMVDGEGFSSSWDIIWCCRCVVIVGC